MISYVCRFFKNLCTCPRFSTHTKTKKMTIKSLFAYLSIKTGNQSPSWSLESDVTSLQTIFPLLLSIGVFFSAPTFSVWQFHPLPSCLPLLISLKFLFFFLNGFLTDHDDILNLITYFLRLFSSLQTHLPTLTFIYYNT